MGTPSFHQSISDGTLRFLRRNLQTTTGQSLLSRRPTGEFRPGASHRLAAVDAFQPANGEVSVRHVLEMVDEYRVDRGAAERADQRYRLRRSLFGNHDRKACRDLRDQAYDSRRRFLAQPFLRDMRCRLGNSARQRYPGGEVAGFGCIVGFRATTQRKHLQALQARPALLELLSLRARYRQSSAA